MKIIIPTIISIVFSVGGSAIAFFTYANTRFENQGVRIHHLELQQDRNTDKLIGLEQSTGEALSKIQATLDQIVHNQIRFQNKFERQEDDIKDIYKGYDLKRK